MSRALLILNSPKAKERATLWVRKAKPSDEWTVPLNHDEHMRQHSMGEREYWQSVGINPLKVAQQLYGISQALRESRVPEEDIVRHMTGIVVRARNEAS